MEVVVGTLSCTGDASVSKEDSRCAAGYRRRNALSRGAAGRNHARRVHADDAGGERHARLPHDHGVMLFKLYCMRS